MKATTILSILLIISTITLSGQVVSESTEEHRAYNTSTPDESANSHIRKSDKDIMNEIIEAGGQIIYSVYCDSIMATYPENGSIMWPDRYAGESLFIYHYYVNGSLFFKIFDPGQYDNEIEIITCSVIDIDCTGDNIFSCTYHCIDTESGGTICIASDLTENQLLVLINYASEERSLALKTIPEEIIRY